MYKQKLLLILVALLSLNMSGSVSGTENTTQRIYLSGQGADDTVPWDFYCTDGMNAGKWMKIGVPSCWELQGFGKYQYGIRFYGKPFPDGIAAEEGMYKYEFTADAAWQGKQLILIFEASMTDTDVKINGRRPGNAHQGGFYRFSYDVTDFLKYGKKNLLEVTVSKESKNASVNLAERRADFWNFGGIIRPVFLEVKPPVNIARVAIDGQADGTFNANIFVNRPQKSLTVKTEIFDFNGKKIAESLSPVKSGGDEASASLNIKSPRLWTAETPERYEARFSLIAENGKILHVLPQKFGFRTIEVKESDGLYINGVRVNIRGVNRHSFRPESGRTLSKAKNIEDVLLIKSMNMNSVRLSHYPADPEFLDACDSLGLYVMNELAGWHGKYDTPTGIPLIKSMVERDVNHPSVIWWANGNEKGWNTELDGEFHKHDPQRRPVIHPQGNFSEFETMHYRSYGESQEYMRLPEIFMPTEFLHGLYDGGHGAGLYDYWEMMRKHPRCAGGFLWVLADEGVKRVDMDGFIDNQGNYGADGIVGPHHEKEGSFYAIKQIWSPVQIMDKTISKDFDGSVNVENRYDFLNLNTCRFQWEQLAFPSMDDTKGKPEIISKGEIKGINIAPHSSGKIDLRTKIDPKADALHIAAIDQSGHELWKWSYRLKKENSQNPVTGKTPVYEQKENGVTITAGNVKYTFCPKTGLLQNVQVNDKSISLGNGPRFFAARRADRSLDQFYNHDDEQAKAKDRTYTEFKDAAVFCGFDFKTNENLLTVTAKYKTGNLDEVQWTFSPDGKVTMDYQYNFSAVVDMMGIRFDYPEAKMQHKRWLGDGPYRVWQNRLQGTVYGLWENDYNDPIPGESFDYPEFKGYFAHVDWMKFSTEEGEISLTNKTPDTYVGVYQPRDGRDKLLYTLPESGISVLNVIPAVRNKVNATDLIGPSSQPKWVDGVQKGQIVLEFK